MEGKQESSVSTSAFSSTEISKVKPKPWSELIKELYITPNEDRFALFQKNYHLMYEAITTTTKQLNEIKKTMIQNPKAKSTKTNINPTDFNVKLEDDLIQLFKQLELKKQELQTIKEKMETQITEVELRNKEMDLLKASVSRNEKCASELEQDIRTWREKYDEIANLAEMQRKKNSVRQATMKLNQLRKMGSQMRVVILEYMSLTAPDDEGNNVPHTPKTKEGHEVESILGKLKKILDELLMFGGEPGINDFSDE